MKTNSTQDNHFVHSKINSDFEADALSKKAQHLISNLKKDFLKEADIALKKMQKTLDNTAYLSQTEKDRVLKTIFFQTVHDLKGQGSTYGFPLVTKIATHDCTVIQSLKTFKQENIEDFKLDILDMQQLLKEENLSLKSPLAQRIIKRLENYHDNS